MYKKVVMIFLILCLFLSLNLIAQTPKQIKRSAKLTEEAMELYKIKKYDLAKDRLAKALKLNPNNVKAHEMAALLYYLDRNFAAAKKHAEIAIKLNKKSAAGYYVLGMISYQKQDQERARLELTQAMKFLKDPDRRARAQNALENLKKLTKRRPIRNFKKKFTQSSDQKNKATSYQPYVAVFPFEEPNLQSAGLGKTLSEMLITALIQQQNFQVMERMQLEKLLQEQSLSQTGVIDEEAALKVGKIAGLEAVILGSVTRLKKAIEADARLIDVETGRALGAASGKVNDVEKIRNLANSLAKELGIFASKIKPKNNDVDTAKKKN